jgi:hypothetical protein
MEEISAAARKFEAAASSDGWRDETPGRTPSHQSPERHHPANVAL